MQTQKAAPWLIGAALVSLLILGLAWMLLISPQLQTAATTRTEATDVRAQNAVQTAKLTQLKAQFAELDTYKAELAGLRVQIPVEDGLPSLLREVDAAAAAAPIFVVSVNPGVPEPFVGIAADPTATAPVPVEAPAGTAEAGGAAAATEAAPEVPVVGVEGMVAIPVEITVLGPYPTAIQFTTNLQRSMQRLFVVTAFTMTGQDEAEPSGGRPATHVGDAEFLIQGYVYVLQETVQAAAVAPTEPAPTGEVATDS